MEKFTQPIWVYLRPFKLTAHFAANWILKFKQARKALIICKTWRTYRDAKAGVIFGGEFERSQGFESSKILFIALKKLLLIFSYFSGIFPAFLKTFWNPAPSFCCFFIARRVIKFNFSCLLCTFWVSSSHSWKIKTQRKCWWWARFMLQFPSAIFHLI